MNPDTQSVAELEALILAKVISEMKKNFNAIRKLNNEIKTEQLMNQAKETLTEKEQKQLTMILEDPIKFDNAVSSIESTYYKELASAYYKEQKFLDGYKEVSQTERTLEYESKKYGVEDTLSINVDFQQQKIALKQTKPIMVKESLRSETKTIHEISFKELEKRFKENQNELRKEDKKQFVMEIKEMKNNDEQIHGKLSEQERKEIENESAFDTPQEINNHNDKGSSQKGVEIEMEIGD